MGLREIVFSLMVGITGCALNQGTITEKIHEEPRKEVEISCLVLQYGYQCYVGKIPILVYGDEDNIVIVRDGERTVRFYIRDKRVFNGLNVGDFFKYDPRIADREDRNVIRRMTREEYENFLKGER